MRDFNYVEPILKTEEKRRMIFIVITIIVFTIILFYFPIRTMAEITSLTFKEAELVKKIENLTHKDELEKVNLLRQDYRMANVLYNKTNSIYEVSRNNDIVTKEMLFSPILLANDNIIVTHITFSNQDLLIAGFYRTRFTLISYVQVLKDSGLFDNAYINTSTYGFENGKDDLENVITENAFNLRLEIKHPGDYYEKE